MRKRVIAFAAFALISSASAKQRKSLVSPPPLVRMEPPIQVVETPVTPLRFSDWSVVDYGDFTDSWTKNASGSNFGVACGSTCLVYLNSGITCSQGEEYPALMSLPGGVRSLNLRCYLLKDHYLLATKFTADWVDQLTGDTVGVAIAMKDGTFGVSRFSLHGIFDALSKALEYRKATKDDGKSLRDFTI